MKILGIFILGGQSSSCLLAWPADHQGSAYHGSGNRSSMDQEIRVQRITSVLQPICFISFVVHAKDVLCLSFSSRIFLHPQSFSSEISFSHFLEEYKLFIFASIFISEKIIIIYVCFYFHFHYSDEITSRFIFTFTLGAAISFKATREVS